MAANPCGSLTWLYHSQLFRQMGNGLPPHDSTDPTTARLAIIPVAGGLATKTFALPPGAIDRAGVAWTPDGRALTYAEMRKGVSNLWNQALEGGPPKKDVERMLLLRDVFHSGIAGHVSGGVAGDSASSIRQSAIFPFPEQRFLMRRSSPASL